MKTRFIFILILAFIYPIIKSHGDEMTSDDLNAAQERANALKERIDLPEHLDNTAEATARSSADYVNSEAFKLRIQVQNDRLEKILYTPSQDKNTEPDKGTADKLDSSEKILIFISSSIPVDTLRTYVEDIAHSEDPNIVMVMRGFIDGMTRMQPTLAFIQSILVKNRECNVMDVEECEVYDVGIEVDPLVFRQLDIQAVPAIAYVQNINLVDFDQSLGKSGNITSELNTTVVYGDVPLCYALEKIYDKTRKRQLLGLIKKVNHGGPQ